MNVNNVILKAVAVKKEQYPEDNKPEFAFVGKSNVGKSSLINLMINRKSYARISQNPGKTRTINFYEIEEKLYFVDLPGYGFAKVPKSETEKWGKMIEAYLLNRPQLNAIVFLIDIRHAPSKNDKMMLDWIRHYSYKLILVLTKADKLTRNEQSKNISMIRKELNLEKDDIAIPFSSLKRTGNTELWDKIEEFVSNFNTD